MNPASIYPMGESPPRKYIPLRVMVVNGATNITLHTRGYYKIVDFKSGEILKDGRSLRKTDISIKDIDSEAIKIIPGRGAHIYVNNRQFRGEIDIIKDADARLLVVNHIDLEEYLYGVLYHEVSHRWPMEVLKVQAIASRTYALYQKLVSKNEYFDLTSDIYSQVYGGRTSETWRTRKAVDFTRGYVLSCEDKIFPSYYHATCGGHTSNANTLWNIDIVTLEARPCDFCKISPHFNWKKELKKKYIEDKLKEAGHKIDILSIEILQRDEAGRILELRLKGKNKDVVLEGNKFRLLVGPNIIRSANFEVEVRQNFITFYGKGWGHGVGMCQWGAYEMARRGWKVEEILEYYYPGAEIVRLE